MQYSEIIKEFDETSLPDLDVVVMTALELFANTTVPKLLRGRFKRPLILGSGNAIAAARTIFAGLPVQFADESNYEAAIFSDVDGAYIFSASGGKHAVTFARALNLRDIPTVLITNNPKPPAAAAVPHIETLVFPKNREPYTYNTSTYMGMFLAVTQENPKAIKEYIESSIQPLITDMLGNYSAYYLIIPEKFSDMSSMFVTKFDELFGSKVMGRVFTFEQTKHAKTVISNDKELFISFGVENNTFGTNRLHIPLPVDANFVAMMAFGYYVIGCIQKQKPPYYKESIASYMEDASAMFGDTLSVIVE